MKGKQLVAAAVMTLAAGAAESATLIGETVYFRFDSQGGHETSIVGPGAEFSAFASPNSKFWAWTVDFGANSFEISAIATQEMDAIGTFRPSLQFRSATPGLIPADPSKITLTETSVSPSLSYEDFDIDSTYFFGGSGIDLGFTGINFPGVSEGTTVRWVGTIDLADVAAVPLPASTLLLLTGLAGLGLVGARRRSR